MITMIIELLKLSAIAFKSYMPEMKLKQQNHLYHFNSRIKALETKLDIVQKLETCVVKSKPATTGRSIDNSFSNGAHSEEAHEEQQHLAIKEDIKKVGFLMKDINLEKYKCLLIKIYIFLQIFRKLLFLRKRLSFLIFIFNLL